MSDTSTTDLAPPGAYIWFSAEVSQSSTASLMATTTNLVASGFKEINLMISTTGGSVAEGFNLYHYLRGLPVRLVTHNVGSVDSIGNVVYLAGTTRYVSPQATFMFHGVTVQLPMGGSFDRRFLA